MISDGHGDYFAPVPDPIDAASGRDGDDLFAELSMYVHAEHFLERMGQLGLTQYRCELSTMLANFRSLPDADDGPYRPLDNAYFTDQCDPAAGVTMLFGQNFGEVDFAVDADVIYHELGHGTVALLTPEGLTQPAKRVDGVTNDAAAINESIADYVSIMLQHGGDAELAEYVGRFWPAQSTPYIRTARNTLRCPQDMIGESHNDGEPLTAALWATRARVGAVMDGIVLDMLVRLPPDARLEDAAAAVLDAAADAQHAGALGADGVALLRRGSTAAACSTARGSSAISTGSPRAHECTCASAATRCCCRFWRAGAAARESVPVTMRSSSSSSSTPAAAVIARRCCW
ncbi:MAG: hypothetical protein U0168_11035 [Nannocystaceae bacterium]